MTTSDPYHPSRPGRSERANIRPQLRPEPGEIHHTLIPEQTIPEPALGLTDEQIDSAETAGINGDYRACRFDGTALEYFKIWIVNIALMLVTFGIYSAWAKVRRNQYIYGNTYFEDSSFVYHASPISILIGRLIFFIPFALLFAANYYDPILANSLTIAIFIIAPYFIVRAMRFRWRITTYRGVAFRFSGTTLESFVIYFFWPIIAAISAFLLYPASIFRRKRWQVTNSYFGKLNFSFHGTTGPLFWIYAKPILLISILLAGVYFFFADFLNFDFMFWLFNQSSLVFILAVVAIIAYSYIKARVTNYTWDNTSIENTRFRCTLSVGRLSFLYATNLLAIVLSFGLLIPWATMRIIKYRVESIHYALRDNIDDVKGAGVNDKSALGEEAAGMFDLGFG